jgi:hypothetical protein|tara:strand:+ start:473 stop:808 length:336 start_codon:yes stop_codon:yes gene_type:complete
MKYTHIKSYLLIGVFFAIASNANAGLFGGSWKPSPSLKLFGQTVSWPIPSLCLGAKAGVLPDAGISPDGINFKIPYFSVELPFPKLTIQTTNSVTDVKVGSIEKSKRKDSK